jgi:hypothetical protein
MRWTTHSRPEQVMRTLKTQVVGSLPQVKTWRTQPANVINGKQHGP